jgi:HAD superfamily phosphoserine phosphatase-like hydrolase
MGRIRLVAFDLDGTLVRGDTVCEVVARRLGHLDRMRALEREATDVPSLIRLREELAAYYRGRSSAALEACLEDLVLAPGIGDAFDLFAKHGIRTAIVTITWTFAARWLARRFGASDVLGCDLTPDGQITHVFPVDKGQWLTALMARLGVGADAVAAVGDSWRDADMFAVAAHRFFVGPALLPGLDAHHQPDGDLAEIARRIVDEV